MTVVNRLLAVGVAVGTLTVAASTVACGGGGGTSSSATPASPSTTTPTTPTTPASPNTVYASSNNRVATASSDPKACDTVVQGGIMGAGWQSNEYGTVGTGAAFTFDLASQLAGRTIAKATLRLYVSDPPQEFITRPQLRLNAFAGDWSPGTLTWNIWVTLAVQSAGEVQLPAPAAPGPLDFDITTIVRNWASGSWKNNGLRLMVNQPEPGQMGRIATTIFYSLSYNNSQSERPQIILEYQ